LLLLINREVLDVKQDWFLLKEGRQIGPKSGGIAAACAGRMTAFKRKIPEQGKDINFFC
jgi:hypothetical protein